MHNKGITYLRAPGKLIQVGVTTGQSLYRAELDNLRLAAISQWPQIMRNRPEATQELSVAVAKAKNYPDGVICLYLQMSNQGKPSVYVEYLNVNLLDSMVDPALVEKSKEQIPLLCWLLQKQLNGPTGWEHLTTTSISSGTHAVDGFGAARLSPTASFAPWGSAIVTAENTFPDILADPSIAEKDYLIYLQTSKLFQQLERPGGEDEVPILWAQASKSYDEGSINIVSAEEVGSQNRRRMLIGVAAAVVISFVGSYLISSSARSQAAPRISGAPEVQKEMKFFLWNKPAVKPEPKVLVAVPGLKQVLTKRVDGTEAAPLLKPEDAAKKRADSLQALGLSQPSDEEKRKAEALKALTK